MKVFVLGASGATGKLVVQELISHGHTVRILIRSTAVFPIELLDTKKIEIIIGSIDDFTVDKLSSLINDCGAVISCLGHNVSFKGLFGRPRRLVFNAIKNIEEAATLSKKPYKIILMSTTAYTNKKDGEKNTFGEMAVFGLLKVLLPPHADNVAAGDFLLYDTVRSANVGWVAVRPDSLFDEPAASDYSIQGKKTRSPIFDPGRTSRINVAHFIVRLISDESLWKEWVYRTPVIYNNEHSKGSSE